MVTQITVNLPREKARQHLLKYFDLNGIEVELSESHSVEAHTKGIYTRIQLFEEEKSTRLTFNFDLRKAYAIFAAVEVCGIMITWLCLASVPLSPENTFQAGALIGALLFFPFFSIVWINEQKKKFVDKIRKAFDLLNKTD
jgi:hypothetical protein